VKNIPKIFIFFCLLSNNLSGQTKQEPLVSTDQLKEDLQYVRKKLEANHPNLYLYTSKAEMDRIFDSLYSGITKPISVLEFYKHLTIISSIIKDGHTIILPGSKVTDYHNKNSRFLPFHFTITGDQLYVDMTCTSDSQVMDGDEIISINDITSPEIIKTLISRQVRDGYNLTYPTWILNNYLREYYSYIFGHPDQFIIKYKHDNTVKISTVSGLLKDSIFYYRKIKYPARINEKKPKEGLLLRFAPDNKYAVLTIKDFHKDVLRKVYEQNFEEVTGNYFTELSEKKTTNLVLDLRDNQGGDISNGAFLLSYLIDTPFKNIDAYYKVDNSQSDFQLKKSTGESLGNHSPKAKVFKGNLYVIVNGGSFSNSGIVASCLKRYNRAIFIGEETGGNNKVLAGDVNDYHLPNTDILIEIPTKQYMLDESAPLTGYGTAVDFPVRQSVKDIIDMKDSILNFTIEFIQKNQ
jgi:hypothetical protein